MLHTLFKSTKAAIKPGHSDKGNDSSRCRSRHHHSDDHSRRRLVRSQNIQGLRYSDDDLSNDTCRNSLFSTGHASETVSASTWDSRSSSSSVQHPNNAVTYLPLPPTSTLEPTLQRNHSVSSARSWDGDMRDLDGISGYSSDAASSDGSFESGANSDIFSAVQRRSEGALQSLPGAHVGSLTGESALQMQGRAHGVELHICTHVERAQISAPNSRLTSPVSSPKAWGSKDSQWLLSSASNDLQQGSSVTSVGSNYEKSVWINAHPLPLPPTRSSSPPISLLSPRSTPLGSSILESGPRVCKWQKGRLLGSGAFGRVYKGIHSETGEFCAIKEVEYVEDDTRSKESAKQLEQEIMLLSSFRHPNIVHYKGSEMVGGSLNIYLELVSGGSIYKLCQEFNRLEEPIVRRYTRQILHGLHFLHSRNTVHRDIKGANILVDPEGTVKLADFGMAKEIKQQGADLLSFKGSPYWMAPEVIMQKNNTGFEYAIDIWSLGCTVLEMLTGKPPWSEYEGVAAMFKVTRAEIPPLPQSLSSEGNTFIKLCLQRNPADRPSAAALLQHPFVQFPNEGSNRAVQKIKIPDRWSYDVEERSPTQQNSDVANGLLRGGSHPVTKRQYSRARLCEHICPSRSAPVSPRSPHKDLYESTPTAAGFSTLPGFPITPAAAGNPRYAGFLTPQPGSPTGMGFPITPPAAGIPRRAGFLTPQPGSPRGMEFSIPPGSPTGMGFPITPPAAGSPRRAGFLTPQPGSPRGMEFSIPPGGSPRHTGFSRPPGGSPRDTGFSRSPAGSPSGGTAFDYYINHGQSSTAAGESTRRQQAHASNGLPRSSIHAQADRGNTQWDGAYENRRISDKGKPRRNRSHRRREAVGIYNAREQFRSRNVHRTVHQRDENVTQAFLESPHQSPRRSGKVF